MDGLTYYGTLFCIILLQVSFFWLFRHDRRGQYLSREQIAAKKLAVVIANYNQQLGKALKNRLEAIGFCVYGIGFECLDEEATSNLDRDCKIFKCRSISEARKLVDKIEADILQHSYKIHACIELKGPSAFGSDNLADALEISKEQLFWSICLSVLLADLIDRKEAKLIIVQDASEPEDRCKDLIRAITTSVAKHLHRWNHRLIELERSQSIASQNSVIGFVGQLVNECLNQVNGSAEEKKVEIVPKIELIDESFVDRIEAELAQM